MASKLDCHFNKYEPLPCIRSDLLLLMASPLQSPWKDVWRVNRLLWFPQVDAASKMPYMPYSTGDIAALQQLMPGMHI